MKYLTFLLAFLILQFGYAQSDQQQVLEALDDFYTTENPVSAANRLREVGSLIPNQHDSLKAEYYVGLGICYGQMGLADSSFMYLAQAKEYAENAGSDIATVKVLMTEGLVYMSMGNYDESLEAYQNALSLTEGHQERRMIESKRKLYGNMAGIYYQLGDLENALDLTTKALDISKQIMDSSSLAYNHLRLALVQVDLGKLTEATDNLNQASGWLTLLGDTTTLVYSENTLGKVFEQQEDLDQALHHYTNALNLARTLGDQEEYALTLLSKANVQVKMGDLSGAEQGAEEVIAFSIAKGYTNSQRMAIDLLYNCARVRGNLRQALDYRNEFIVLSDSLNGLELQERIAEIETKYETERIETENQRLVLENELKDANLATSRIVQLAIAIAAILFSILLAVYFSQRNKKLKAEKEAQDLQVEALYKRLTDLNISPSKVTLDLESLNRKLNTPLSEREFEALRLSLDGLSNAEIADKLFISTSTVKFHLRNTYGKLGVSNRKEALEYVVKTT